MNKPNNPPAFPTKDLIKIEKCGQGMGVESIRQDGMTFRDYFAGKIINGICSNQFYMSAILEDFKGITDEKMKSKIAKISYEMADAMLAERIKT